MTGEYLVPAILGGDKTAYAGNLIAQQFLEAQRLAVRCGDRNGRRRRPDDRAPVYARALGKQEQYGG